MKRFIIALMLVLGCGKAVGQIVGLRVDPPIWALPETVIELNQTPKSAHSLDLSFGNGGTTRIAYFSSTTDYRYVAIHYLHTWGKEEFIDYDSETTQPQELHFDYHDAYWLGYPNYDPTPLIKK